LRIRLPKALGKPSLGPPLSSNSPLVPEAAKQLALEHLSAGRLSEAKALLASLLDHGAEDPELRYHYALALIRTAQGHLALEQTRKLLAGHGDWPGAHAIHGEALLSIGDYQGALKEFDWIVAAAPSDPLATLKRGFALSALGRFDEAYAAFAAAQKLDNAFVAGFCRELAQGTEISASLIPENIFLWRRYLARRECDWRDWNGYLATFRRAIADDSISLERGLLHAALHLPLSGEDVHMLARKVAGEVESRVTPLPPRRGVAGQRRLRIGILSAGFRTHVDALLLLPLFELADRRRFDLYAYSLAADDRSGSRDRIRRNAHVFRDLSALNSQDCAQQIRRDEIDILVDAVGHADGGRFEITAARPAPLQVLYLGFASTLGSTRVDYTILDPVVAPESRAADWSEQIVRLPETYFLYDFRVAPKALPLTRQHYGLPADRPVLCALHKAEKIDPATFALWMRVLHSRPSAVLWLLGESERIVGNLRHAAQAAGIEAARLIFTGREDYDRYLARFRLADVFLDTLQHNAIVTACDCLASGLPVLTSRGSTFTSRAAESLLRAANLPDLVAPDAEDYVRKIIELIDNPERVAALRRHIEAERTRAALFDTAARVRELESAFAEMWRLHLSGARPASFSVRRNAA
jgi:protein O-GlcNAc transferase